MYKIQTPTGETFLTEKPNFIRVHSNGMTFILTEQSKAEGIAYHGIPYLWKDGAICYEVDSADELTLRTQSAQLQADIDYIAMETGVEL